MDILTPKQYAKFLVELHTLYQGDNGALKEFYTDKLEALRHARNTLKQMYEFGRLNGLNEPLMFLNATEKELNKILKQL